VQKSELDRVLHDIEWKNRNLPYEVGTIVDRQGKILNVTVGGNDRVAPPTELLKDNIFTHNHPRNTALAADDVKSFVADDLYEVRASTDKAVYSLMRSEDSKPDEFLKALGENTGYLKASKAVMEDVKSGKITMERYKRDAQTLTDQKASEMMDGFLSNEAKKYGYEYRKYELSEEGFDVAKSGKTGILKAKK
jgi:hypothetical protein